MCARESQPNQTRSVYHSLPSSPSRAGGLATTSAAGSIASTSGCSVASIDDRPFSSRYSRTSSGSCCSTSTTSAASGSSTNGSAAAGSSAAASASSSGTCSVGSFASSAGSSAAASASSSGSVTCSVGRSASAWCAGTPQYLEPGSAAFGQRLPFERIAAQRPEKSPPSSVPSPP